MFSAKLTDHSAMAFYTLQREKLVASVWLCLNMEKYVVQVTHLKPSIHQAQNVTYAVQRTTS
jgi:hypothetical protein